MTPRSNIENKDTCTIKELNDVNAMKPEIPESLFKLPVGNNRSAERRKNSITSDGCTREKQSIIFV